MKLYKDMHVLKTMTEEERRTAKLQHDFSILPSDVLFQAQKAVILYDMQQSHPKYKDCHNLDNLVLQDNSEQEFT